MAKIKFGMMMTDARGKLGGQVFSKNRAGAYIRTKVTPVNPQTTAQSAVRSRLAQISASWNSLSDSARSSFNSSVEAWQSTDIFGDIKKPSGKNLYTKLNLNLLNAGLPAVTEAPAKALMPPLDDVTATYSTTTSTLELSNLIVLGNGKFVVEATPPLNAGVSFAKNRFRQILAENPVGSTPLDITASYVAKFGALSGGENVQIRVKFIGENGQSSPPIIVKMATV